MLDRQFVRKNPDLVKQGAARKSTSAPVDEFLRIDEEWRQVKHRLDTANGEMKQSAKQIGQLMGQGKKEEAEEAKAKTGELKQEIRELEAKSRELEEMLAATEMQFPNMPHESVPEGKSADDNPIVRQWGEKPAGTYGFKPHYEIAEELGIIDFERGTRISGSGFVVYRRQGARLLRALVNWMIDFQVEQRYYEEVYPPFMVHAASMTGTGNLPKFSEELYETTRDDLWLIPTAEVPVTNMYRDEIIDGTDLPIRLAAYSACFRREAGAAGKETRGIQRMHQFDKVELVKFTLPEESYRALEILVQDAEAVLQALGLHYRVIELCTGDIGDKGAKAYDLEVWSPAEERYLEVSSCTNFEAFQARRANIRFRRSAGEKPEFVHTLNGSGLAVPRLMVALLETYRLPDGDVKIPPVLESRMGASQIEKLR
jgi:seryl-tRNA synthetase